MLIPPRRYYWTIGNRILYRVMKNLPNRGKVDTIIVRTWSITKNLSLAINPFPGKDQYLGEGEVLQVVLAHVHYFI
jgi:hypothetical protein